MGKKNNLEVVFIQSNDYVNFLSRRLCLSSLLLGEKIFTEKENELFLHGFFPYQFFLIVSKEKSSE
jgi:hypothetical protein